MKLVAHYTTPEDGILPEGRLQQFYQQWKRTVNPQWPLSVIEEGYRLQFRALPSPWKIKPMKLSPLDHEAVSLAVEKFLKAGIIEISPTQNEDYLSNFFTIQEPTKRRPILDCTQLNQFLQYQHFKMERVPALRQIIEKDDLMCKLDLKDAYVVVPIHPTSQQFLTFKHQNIVYQYRSMAFGLSVAPRVFTKIMRYALEPLRMQSIRFVYYLDDICVLEKTKEKMSLVMKLIIEYLTKLGFLVVFTYVIK